MYIFEASSKYTTIIQCHFGRVENVHDATKMTLKYNGIFRRPVKIYMTRHRTYISLKRFSCTLKTDCTRPKYSLLFSTRRKYVRLFWTRPK